VLTILLIHLSDFIVINNNFLLGRYVLFCYFAMM